MFNELREFDTLKNNWSVLCPDLKRWETERPKDPDARTAHSLVAYRSNVVLFGGGGAFIPSIKLRMGYNDLWMFDTQGPLKHWERV